MNEDGRSRKFNKFGGINHGYYKDTIQQLKAFFYREIGERLPQAQIFY